MQQLKSYVKDNWFTANNGFKDIKSAIDDRVIAQISSQGIDFKSVLEHARTIGGQNLRALDFHQRANLVKKIALYLEENKEKLYQIAFESGATRRDSWPDIDGGIITLFAYASRVKKELTKGNFIIDGPYERLSKNQSFMGQHILTPRQGVAVHINAVNFPCWGMLEKLAPSLIAGMPVVTKPASASAYIAEAMVQMIIDADILPKGALQLICGDTGDLFDHLGTQDVVSFTGSAQTAQKLQNHPIIAKNAVRFIAERDSLNSAILGSDVAIDAPEYALFIKEVTREMTAKAGQKCTAIRRIMVPRALCDSVIASLSSELQKYSPNDPRGDKSRMGLLVSKAQVKAVLEAAHEIAKEAHLVYGSLEDKGQNNGFDCGFAPLLFLCDEPLKAHLVHEVEAFGPVATIMPYDSLDEAIELVKKGEGSLVASLYSYDDEVAQKLTFGIAPYHGRLYLLDRDDAGEATGHGAPLPALIHGGPGRAGGGEEMGGLIGIAHYMQRTALQGSPQRLSQLLQRWQQNSVENTREKHPFQLNYDNLRIGDTIRTKPRTISLDDIEHFAEFTGDKFYAHMNEEAALKNPFFKGRVAHGYLLLSFAAGLFVDPEPGPLLANYGIESLRFLKPVKAGDAIHMRLTVKEKRPSRAQEYGEVRWDAEIFNQDNDTVARYELLTMSETDMSKKQ